jgi:S-DNA-T family DNA segregation ATPase FtsK/SpoIIIE
MAKKTRSKAVSTEHPQAVGRYLAWTLLAGLWLLVLLAMASFDPADPPNHAYAAPNLEIQNWVGSVGALVAYKINLVVGPGAWVALAGIGAFLIATALGRKVDQLILRALGLIIMTLATSAMIGAALPNVMTGMGSRPEGGAGLLSLYVNDKLSTRFAVPGTLLIMLVAFWVGAILAADQLVLALPKALARLILGTRALKDAAAPALSSRFSAFSFLFRRKRRKPEQIKPAVPVRSSRSRRAVPDEELIDEDAGGLGATESFNPDEHLRSPVTVGDEEDDDEAAVAADAPGAYLAEKKNFDPEALRAKIKQLPINFAPAVKISSKATPPREPDFSGYQFPGMELLEEPETNFTQEMEQIVREQALSLESALQQYRISGEVVGIDSGPVITLFEVRLAPGTKVAQLSAISSDLARALKAQNIRIVPNMAGKDTVGIEVPNLKKERVRLKELMTVDRDNIAKMKLPMFLGKDASGNPLVQDLAAMPHMLIAGTTGSGKSVCMNSIIMSFLFTKRPDELKLVLVDPKMVEMSMFKDIPHLMCPVVTEMGKAAAILEWAVTKMDERYELLAEAGVRDINGYNILGWDELKERMNPATEEEEARLPKKLPYMVFVIDELADLMMTNKEVEGSIVRIAQKARAVGIHLILATQRPQANVVTGLIKSNMPSRVAFKVASGMDSRIVLDQKGGELLLGQGDMLFLSPRSSKLTRAQGSLVDDIEIRRTVKFLKEVAQQAFEPQLIQIRSGAGDEPEDLGERDPLFEDAVEVVMETQRGSVSLLQRRLTIGYSRASRLIEQMAAAGIIGEYKGSQAREVQIGIDEWEAMKAQAAADAAAAANQAEDDENAEDEEQDLEYEDDEQAEDDDDAVPDEIEDEYRQ